MVLKNHKACVLEEKGKSCRAPFITQRKDEEGDLTETSCQDRNC